MRIPHRHQINGDYCGPAVIQMILAAHSLRPTQRDIAKRAGTNAARGTTVKGLAAALRGYGFTVSEREQRSIADLRRALSRGNFIIINYTERSDWGHFALLLRFTKKYVHLLDPAERQGGTARFPLAEFKERWRDPMFTKTTRWAAFVKRQAPAKRVRSQKTLLRRRSGSLEVSPAI